MKSLCLIIDEQRMYYGGGIDQIIAPFFAFFPVEFSVFILFVEIF